VTFFTRWGQALIAPRAAMARADDDPLPGRPASDLMRALALVLVVAHTRELVAAGWIATRLGVKAALPALTSAIAATATWPLVFTLVATLVITTAAGRRRALGRDADLACVAALAPTLVALVASTIGKLVPLGAVGRAVVLAVALGAGAVLAVHAIVVARRRTP